VTESQESASPKKHVVRRTLLIGAAFILGFVVLGVIAIQVWEYSNSVGFCANACHDVHPEEIQAFQDSFHANVKCTECHMGRGGTIRSMVLKASHARHLPEVIFDLYDRPIESETMRPANESCELCHWPPAFHGDTVREIRRFQPNEENDEKRIYLILKTGAATREQGLGYGIHWHITNPVEYIATDEHKQDIPWVRTTLPDGRTLEYNDVTNPLTPEEIADAEKKVMDCVDCHNRMGHPFPTPEEMIDQALADGRLSADLPFVKSEMMDLLTAEYSSREEALAAVDTVREQYETNYPETVAEHPEAIEQAYQLALEFVNRLVFEEADVNWQDFQTT
jgi:nitrate/TMAO reductase-like tetraheme cytochrome c subunit